ncbi:MAG: response regulator [Leptospiraceae bacterium]|nr:response regulator [Leptospiraceae bacterium]MCP5512370.1 response regulator [Leptospiraceae bacterium]
MQLSNQQNKENLFKRIFLFTVFALLVIFSSQIAYILLIDEKADKKTLSNYHLRIENSLIENPNLMINYVPTYGIFNQGFLRSISKNKFFEAESFEDSIETMICPYKNPNLKDSGLLDSHKANICDFFINKFEQSQASVTSLELLKEKEIAVVSNLPQYSVLLINKIDKKFIYFSIFKSLYVLVFNSLFFGFTIIVLFRYYYKISNQLIDENSKAKNEAEMASKAKTMFIANVNHEIRNPLNGIIGSIELLNKNSHNPEEVQKYLKVISSSGSHLLSLVNNVLNISKIESNQLELDIAKFNLYELMDEVSNIFQAESEKRNTPLKIEFLDKFPNHFMGDPTKIRQIIFNIVSNAFKFTQSGLISIAFKWVDESREKIHITIRDTGKGISSEKLKYIFEPFKQEDSTITRKFGGTGLGLSIVKKLVEFLNGDITIKSQLGLGTSFDIVLPLSVCARWREGSLDEKHCLGCKSNSTLRDEELATINSELTESEVLIVDDDEINVMILNDILTSYHFTNIHSVSSAEDALLKIQERHFDFILTDLHMQGMDGLELTRLIRLHHNSTNPIVVGITGDNSENIIDSCYKSGMNHVLSKPFRGKEILDSMKKRYLEKQIDFSIPYPPQDDFPDMETDHKIQKV